MSGLLLLAVVAAALWAALTVFVTTCILCSVQDEERNEQ